MKTVLIVVPDVIKPTIHLKEVINLAIMVLGTVLSQLAGGTLANALCICNVTCGDL